ncbi:MAG: 2-oxoacid:ferredoxin oxidoreductase subunit beta [Lachnospiraceae bacterium]|jgi:2-oxoglutarate ferredoxin oxidoreductase subunit beta|nr:2-oxoacid:ferredoxin oxidoreductase subunit beta [Lachnospiraceae bacterium]
MSELKINPRRKYLRPEKLPHFFCSGCGCGQVLNYYMQALEELDMDPQKMVHVAGVGCTARIPVYIKTDMFHGVHGRTLAWATGVKMMKPDMPVVIFAGDGDVASIGGNHLIHAARRNLDVTVVMVNNMNFAMTGGQVAPTTPEKARTMTTPYGSAEPRFDVCALAQAAGATHVERWTTAQPVQCKKALERALNHKGFSLIEIVSQCPTHFGRYALKTGDPGAVIAWIKEHTYTDAQAKKMSPEEMEGKLRCGEYIRVEKPVYEGTNELK